MIFPQRCQKHSFYFYFIEKSILIGFNQELKKLVYALIFIPIYENSFKSHCFTHHLLFCFKKFDIYLIFIGMGLSAIFQCLLQTFSLAILQIILTCLTQISVILKFNYYLNIEFSEVIIINSTHFIIFLISKANIENQVCFSTS